MNLLSAIGNAAYNAAAMTGMAAGTEQPPYPCASPLEKIDDINDVKHIEEVLQKIYTAGREMMNENWQIVDFQDPDEGGDLVLYTKPHVGPFNFARATISLHDCPIEKVVQVMHSELLEDRKRCSADLTGFEILGKPTPKSNIQHVTYWAPPPVASRDFCFLVGRTDDDEEGTTYIYGCSVDYAGCPKAGGLRTVRGSCMWMWELTSLGSHTLATYVSCLNPRGWTPTFVVGWLKTEIAKELLNARRLLYGIEFTVEKTTAQDLGVTTEDIERETQGQPEQTE